MKNPFRYFKTSPEIIRLAVMMQVRFPLSLRNVEDLLHERGIEVSHKTIRFWWNRFGPIFAAEIRKKRMDRMRAFSGWRWHLDEMFVKINGEGHYLWRAVDQEGEVLEAFVSKKRDRDAALKFLRKLMKRYGRPDPIITDRGRPNSLSSVENSVLATFPFSHAPLQKISKEGHNEVKNPAIMVTCYQDFLVLYSSHIARNRLDFDPFLNPKRRPAS